MQTVSILGQSLELGGEEGDLDGILEFSNAGDWFLLGFRNYGVAENEDWTPSQAQIAVAEGFLRHFDQHRQTFLAAVQKHMLENMDEYFLPDEIEEARESLEQPLAELQNQFDKPFLKIGEDLDFVFGYYESGFDMEHGVAAAYVDGEIEEISSAGNLA
jgi:hypothetical protein